MKNNLIKGILTLALSTAFANVSFAQSQLTVNCYDSESVYNAILVDGDILEYNVCSFGEPAFYVAVIDQSSCSAWGTNYGVENPDHSFGNANNNGGCRPRVENYFVFYQNDSLQLAGMLNMLQQIPNGHSVIIYTPISYNYALINATNPNIIQELSSRWDPGVIEGNEIMVLYGVEGNSSSYVEETMINDGLVSFTTTVCDVTGIADENASENLLIKVEGNTLFLNPSLAIDQISMMDATGKVIPFVKSDNVLTLNQSVSTGIYLFQVEIGKKVHHMKLLISF